MNFRLYWKIIKKLDVEPNYISTTEIRNYLRRNKIEVSKSTLERALRDLESELNIKKKKKGRLNLFAWNKRSGAPKLGTMPADKAFCYTLSRSLLEETIPSKFLSPLRKDFNAANRVLLNISKNNFIHSIETTNTSPNFKDRDFLIGIAGECLASISEAIINNLTIFIYYDLTNSIQNGLDKHNILDKDAYKENTELEGKGLYEANPLGFLVYDNNVYLVITIQGDENERIFELRAQYISEVVISDEDIVRPANFDIEQYATVFLQGQNTFLDDCDSFYKLTLNVKEVAINHIEKTPFSDDQKITIRKNMRHDNYRVTATVPNNKNTISLILNFGSNVEVIGPYSLLKYFKEYAQGFRSTYL